MCVSNSRSDFLFSENVSLQQQLNPLYDDEISINDNVETSMNIISYIGLCIMRILSFIDDINGINDENAYVGILL